MNNLVLALRRWVFRFSTKNLGHTERQGLKRAAKMLLGGKPLLLIVVVITSIGAALFEGGTVGILGLAVSVLVDAENQPLGKFPSEVQGLLSSLIAGRSVSGVFLFLVGVAIIAQVVKSILLYVSQALQIVLAMTIRRNTQREVTSHIMNISYATVMTYPAGSLAGYIEESACVQEVVDLTLNLLRAGFISTVYFILLFAVSVKMTAVSVIVVILLWLSLSGMVGKVKVLSDEATKAKVFTWRWTVEFLNMPRLLRVFDSTDRAGYMINKARDDVLFPERKSAVLIAAIKPSIEIVIIIGAGAFLILGYLFAGDGAQAAIPSLFVFVLVLYRIKPQIMAFNDVRVKVAKLMPRLALVAGFLETSKSGIEERQGKRHIKLEHRIDFKNVCFQYSGSNQKILKDLNFSIEKGKTVGLVGPSGAGKSTIADVLLALNRPTSGTVLVDGIDLEELSVSDWRNKIGFVDQDISLLNASIEDNICFGRDGVEFEAIRLAAEIANADEFINRIDGSYEAKIGDRGYKLSGGQQQRLALARALIRKPEILILDEATSALDTLSEQLIKDAIDDMHGDRTILIIAHRLSTIADADLILYLSGGQIIETGTKDELLQLDGHFSRLWRTQMTGKRLISDRENIVSTEKQ